MSFVTLCSSVDVDGRQRTGACTGSSGAAPEDFPVRNETALRSHPSLSLRRRSVGPPGARHCRPGGRKSKAIVNGEEARGRRYNPGPLVRRCAALEEREGEREGERERRKTC